MYPITIDHEVEITLAILGLVVITLIGVYAYFVEKKDGNNDDRWPRG